MKPRHLLPLALAGLTGILAGGALAANEIVTMPGVADPRRAEVNWILKCQGGHRPDGSGTPQTAPPLAGQVSRFVRFAGGREYLGRVPGVAEAALGDAELAELLNWTLRRFDPAHLPAGFQPYSATEIAKLRKRPLRTDATLVRTKILNGAPSGHP